MENQNENINNNNNNNENEIEITNVEEAVVSANTKNDDKHKDEVEQPSQDEENNENNQLDSSSSLPTTSSSSTLLPPSHFLNVQAHSIFYRFGIPLLFVLTLVLLLNADIGSGISADYVLSRSGEVVEHRSLFQASIFSSVTELWHNGSYPLAILIAITSIAWPYVKICLSLYCWMVPFHNINNNKHRRELFIEIIDALGKWSFVDIIVLVEIMVAFRATIRLSPQIDLDILVVPKWGFYGFVVATMFSLLGTHMVLNRHRQVIYQQQKIIIQDQHQQTNKQSNNDNVNDDSNKENQQEGIDNTENDNENDDIGLGVCTLQIMIAVGLTIFSLTFYTIGCILNIFEVSNTRGNVTFNNQYSIFSIGKAIPPSSLDANDIGIRYIQIMWFVLVYVMPCLCTILFCLIFILPISKSLLRHLFFAAEISFSWSCAEVLLVSTIFAVLQLPTFGDGLIDADCSACFSIGSNILSPFAILCIGLISSIATNLYLYRTSHAILYHDE